MWSNGRGMASTDCAGTGKVSTRMAQRGFPDANRWETPYKF
jgi:hypothetical protein